MLAIKINIVLEININSFFSEILSIKLFVLKLADQLATWQFKEALKEKERKHLPGSREQQKKEKEKKEKLKQNGGQLNKGGNFVRS